MCPTENLEILWFISPTLYKPDLYTPPDQNLKYPNFNIVVNKETHKCWKGLPKILCDFKITLSNDVDNIIWACDLTL